MALRAQLRGVRIQLADNSGAIALLAFTPIRAFVQSWEHGDLLAKVRPFGISVTDCRDKEIQERACQKHTFLWRSVQQKKRSVKMPATILLTSSQLRCCSHKTPISKIRFVLLHANQQWKAPKGSLSHRRTSRSQPRTSRSRARTSPVPSAAQTRVDEPVDTQNAPNSATTSTPTPEPGADIFDDEGPPLLLSYHKTTAPVCQKAFVVVENPIVFVCLPFIQALLAFTTVPRRRPSLAVARHKPALPEPADFSPDGSINFPEPSCLGLSGDTVVSGNYEMSHDVILNPSARLMVMGHGSRVVVDGQHHMLYLTVDPSRTKTPPSPDNTWWNIIVDEGTTLEFRNITIVVSETSVRDHIFLSHGASVEIKHDQWCGSQDGAG